jgi:hypothetical protein
MPSLTTPDFWNSVHRPILYRYYFDSYYFGATAASGTGTQFVLANPSHASNFTVGQRVNIATGIYAGNYTVQSIVGNAIKLNVTYISGAAGNLAPMANIAAELWAGYPIGHPAYADNPIRKIADIVGVPSVYPYAEINVSGFLKGLFKKVTPPVIGPDWKMSSPFYLKVAAIKWKTRYVINGTWKQTDLNNWTGFFGILNARDPIHFKDGVCIYSMLRPLDVRGGHIVNFIGTQGAGVVGGLGFSEIGTTFVVG